MKWLVALLLFCAIPVHAQPVMLNLGNGSQEQPLWCWAAVSAMAIRSFPADPDPTGTGKKFRHLTQLQVYSRYIAGATTLKKEFPADSDIAAAVKTEIDDTERFCAASPEYCDRTGYPMLYDIDHDVPKAKKALSMEAIKLDIDGTPAGQGNGHPIVIQWDYRPVGCPSVQPNPNDPSPGGKSFSHALIITGYNIAAQEVHIFDPLPVKSVPNPRADLYYRWIPYSAYLNPTNHEGIAIVAQHGSDRFRMRRMGKPVPARLSKYRMVSVPESCPQQSAPGGFVPDEALHGAINRYMESRKGRFPDSEGNPRKGKISTGKPVPVVALGVNQLSDGIPLESLLVPRANAYVIPVLEEKDIVDSFLLLPKKDGWEQGGYSNNQIAYLLATLSATHRKKLLPGEVFYLVSIPEMASYFIAHGFEDKAKLLSLHRAGSEQFEDAKCAINAVVAGFRHARKGSKAHPIKQPATSQ